MTIGAKLKDQSAYFLENAVRFRCQGLAAGDATDKGGGNSPGAIIKVCNSVYATKKVRAPTQPLTLVFLDLQTITVYFWANGVKLRGGLSLLPFASSQHQFFLLPPAPF